jgi:serine/threonine protein kinase
LLNPSDFKIFIADYGLKQLKKYCKFFHGYVSINQWSAPEVWSGDLALQSGADAIDNSISIDSYSYGMMLWELETGNIPFEGLDEKTMKHMLLEKKLRPQIPEGTDPKLSLLIRRCW